MLCVGQSPPGIGDQFWAPYSERVTAGAEPLECLQPLALKRKGRNMTRDTARLVRSSPREEKKGVDLGH